MGEEGREAFEARLSRRCRCPNTSSHLPSQVDIPPSTVARNAKRAKPLLEKIPAGVYRELLADELANVVRLDPQRLAAALNTGASAGHRRGAERRTRSPAAA